MKFCPVCHATINVKHDTCGKPNCVKTLTLRKYKVALSQFVKAEKELHKLAESIDCEQPHHKAVETISNSLCKHEFTKQILSKIICSDCGHFIDYVD